MDGEPCVKCTKPVTCDMRFRINRDLSVEHVNCHDPYKDPRAVASAYRPLTTQQSIAEAGERYERTT